MKKFKKNLIPDKPYKGEDVIIPVEPTFQPEKANLLLHIDSKAPDLESKKEKAEQLGLSQKKEFHLTVVGSETGEEILKFLENVSQNEKESYLNRIKEWSESIKWEVFLKNDFYYIQKEYDDSFLPEPNQDIHEKRQSIIQMAEIVGLAEFYQKLNVLFGKQFPIPLPHITLYTTSNREDKKLRGIGIYSEKQFEELKPEKI